MAKQILPNRTRYEVTGQPGQGFSSKIGYISNPNMFFHVCTVEMLSTNSASQASMVKNVKLEHDLDLLFGISGPNPYNVRWTAV